MNVANCMQRGTFSGCICYCYKAPECNNRTAKEKTRRYIMYLFSRKLNWVGYGAVAVAYIEQIVLIDTVHYMYFKKKKKYLFNLATNVKKKKTIITI